MAIEERARFDNIRYASCWEDADVLLEAMAAKEGQSFISIASGGDNSFALLTRNPKTVIALDISPAQLACVEIKKQAFRQLEYGSLLAFLGVHASDTRLQVYRSLRPALSKDTQDFWDNNIPFIRAGIIHAGKFEHYFHIFRKMVLPLVHNRKTVREILSQHDEQARREFYHSRWNTKRWRILFKIFFSRALMGRLGRDPEFFKYVETDVASRIFTRAEYAFTVLPTHANPYLEYILTGNFAQSLPFYLRRAHFDMIRKSIDRLVIFKGNVMEAFQRCPQARFDGFNLSDIFEYMSHGQYEKEVRCILDHANPGARLVYWNMLADRKEIDGLEGKIIFLDQEASQLFKQDKAFFYKSLIIGEAL
jgi:S-adenosylmethionine-diacylglycerol 3-amino-3-carboxypropyl transferase